MSDIELTQRALKACGYRTKLRERCGTQWVEARKHDQVRYVHWHPLTNITQAMQLLIEERAPHSSFTLRKDLVADDYDAATFPVGPTVQDLINAQCRAIVTAIAGLGV